MHLHKVKGVATIPQDSLERVLIVVYLMSLWLTRKEKNNILGDFENSLFSLPFY